MPPPVHQFGLPHQSATSVTQSLPSLVPQSSLMQPHVLPSAMVPLQQLPLVSEQVGQSFILQMPKSLLLFCYCLMHNIGMCGWVWIMLISSNLPKCHITLHPLIPSVYIVQLPQQQQLQFHEHEACRQQQLGASLLSQLSTQPSEVLQQQPAMPEPGQSLYKEKLEPVSEQQQEELPIQQHHQPPVLQGPHVCSHGKQLSSAAASLLICG